MTSAQRCLGTALDGVGVTVDSRRAASAPTAEPTVLGVYTRLLDGLARARVPWCYWKSSRRAAAVLAGESDLDILVAPDGQSDARRVLSECGFRQFSTVPSRSDATVACYLAFDEQSGQIAHVDLHTQLKLGGTLLKTHRLPWEDTLIRDAAPRADLRLPLLDPASEAVLLVVRACLELRRSDPVVAHHWSALTEKFALDRADLAARVDYDAIRARAAQLLNEPLAVPVAQAMFDPLPLQHLRPLRRRLRRALARYRTCGVLASLVRGAARGCDAAAGRLNRDALHWPRPWNRRVKDGGVVVAVVAVDGAGKSTLVRGLCDWLGPEVDVLPLYFGTGDGRPSWFLLPLKLMVPLVLRLLPRKPKGASHGVVTGSAPGLGYGLLLALWACVLALEKRLKLRVAQRAAQRGMVVITDRYPQNELADFNDGPLLPRLPRVPGWLRTFEASAYDLAARLHPDLVIKLVAAPELIATREPTMDPAVIRARVAGVRQLKLGGAPIATISAALPAAEVLRVAKLRIWRVLQARDRE